MQHHFMFSTPISEKFANISQLGSVRNHSIQFILDFISILSFLIW